MRITFLPSCTHLAWVTAAALAALLLVDTGSLVLTRLSTPGHTRDAGQAAAQEIEGRVLSQQTAVRAHDTARDVAADHALRISTEDFRVLADGRVRLTGNRTVPTFLMHRLPLLRDHIEVRATETVGVLPHRSDPR